MTYNDPYHGFPIVHFALHPYTTICQALEAFEAFGPLELEDDDIEIYTDLHCIWSLWGELERNSQEIEDKRHSSPDHRSSHREDRKNLPKPIPISVPSNRKVSSSSSL